MRNLLSYIENMNLLVWVVGLFGAHAIMYLLLGTDTWVVTALLAAAFWGGVLLVAKMAAKRRSEDKEGAQ